VTTIYYVGNGSGSYTPLTTVSAQIDCFGAGQASTLGTTAGASAGWARKNAFSLTAGTPVPFQLGAPGLTGGTNGGDTWFSTSATIIANGGGSATTRIGDTTFAGAAANTHSANGNPGGAGAGGPNGAGNLGGSADTLACGSGGGGNGGGTVGADSQANIGGNGGNGFAGTGGAGGNQGRGATGGKGAGGGGAGIGGELAGDGGDDWDNGGGGGGGARNTPNGGGNGGVGGTPGGGGGCSSSTAGTAKRGGYSVIKIVYTGSDPDQTILMGGAQPLTSWRRAMTYRV
jgi:hypothetical protein